MVDNPADFYRRIPKRNRHKTILEELYHDVQVKKYIVVVVVVVVAVDDDSNPMMD
jgi:hypothetical protein